MGNVAELFRGFVKGTGIFFQKVGAFLLGIFVLGLLAGGYIVAFGLSALWFLAFLLAIVVMWNDFGEGIAIILLLIVLFVFFPDIFPPVVI
jgi:hypothetical protein